MIMTPEEMRRFAVALLKVTSEHQTASNDRTVAVESL